MPYDHRNTTPDGAPSEQMRSLLSKLNNVHCHKRCVIGSGGGSVGFVLLKTENLSIQNLLLSIFSRETTTIVVS
jgi:hypothetical protein